MRPLLISICLLFATCGRTQSSAVSANDLSSKTVGSTVDIPLPSSVKKASLTFCFIPSGTFTMGSPASEQGRSKSENQVEVTMSQPFWLAKTEVTQAQWVAVMGSNPSFFKGDNLPVESVSWEDAQAFIAKLNNQKIAPQGWKFALPTEAQWEYACRTGKKGLYFGGSLDEVAWYVTKITGEMSTHEVGQKKPNAWGLYDMHGNVWEWCADWFIPSLKGGVDPVGPSSGVNRVCRGGSSFGRGGGARHCRAASRFKELPDTRSLNLGFRPALVVHRN